MLGSYEINRRTLLLLFPDRLAVSRLLSDWTINASVSLSAFYVLLAHT